MNRFEGKRAVVTGAGRGIGREVARGLAMEGASVAVLSRSKDSCAAAAREIAEACGHGEVYPHALDVAKRDEVQETSKAVLEQLGGIDILVNAAGITRDRLTARISEEAWDEVLDTNLKGAFLMVQAFQRSILRSPSGRIVNLSSIAGIAGNAGQTNYASSKAGILGLTKSLAREFAGRKVTVNAVAPGFIRTDMTDEMPEAQVTALIGQIPLGSLGEVEDAAAPVLFLCREEAGYVTGQVIVVDGGLVM